VSRDREMENTVPGGQEGGMMPQVDGMSKTQLLYTFHQWKRKKERRFFGGVRCTTRAGHKHVTQSGAWDWM